MERKGERVGGVNENGSVFGWREWRDGGDHAGQRIIEENRKRERERERERASSYFTITGRRVGL